MLHDVYFFLRTCSFFSSFLEHCVEFFEIYFVLPFRDGDLPRTSLFRIAWRHRNSNGANANGRAATPCLISARWSMPINVRCFLFRGWSSIANKKTSLSPSGDALRCLLEGFSQLHILYWFSILCFTFFGIELRVILCCMTYCVIWTNSCNFRVRCMTWDMTSVCLDEILLCVLEGSFQQTAFREY